VLSGFVIAYSAEASSAFLFLRSRFLRLMPAVWICASLAFALLIEEGMIPFNELLPLYLKTIILIPKRPWIDTVYWSLCVEVAFYGLILSLLLANRFCRVEFVCHLKKRGEPYHPAVDLLHAWPKKTVTTTLRRSLTAAPRWTALDKLSAAPWGVNRSPNRSSRFQHLKRGIQDASLSLSLNAYKPMPSPSFDSRCATARRIGVHAKLFIQLLQHKSDL